MQLCQRAVAKASTDSARVNDLACATHTQQQCTQVRTAARRLREADNHELLASQTLTLLPVLAPPRAVGRRRALGNHALQSQLGRLGEKTRPLALRVIAVAQNSL